jgi:hypothetical protein
MAVEKGPQTVTKHGKDSVVVISAVDYLKLRQPDSTLIEFFRGSPLSKVEIDLKRHKSQSRHVELRVI